MSDHAGPTCCWQDGWQKLALYTAKKGSLSAGSHFEHAWALRHVQPNSRSCTILALLHDLHMHILLRQWLMWLSCLTHVQVCASMRTDVLIAITCVPHSHKHIIFLQEPIRSYRRSQTFLQSAGHLRRELRKRDVINSCAR